MQLTICLIIFVLMVIGFCAGVYSLATVVTCCTLPVGAGATVAGELNGGY